jgi:transcription antitermination factor NusG
MYVIFSSPKIIKTLTHILSDKGFLVMPTKLKEYVIVRRDPRRDIPDSFRDQVKVEEFNESYYSFLQGDDSLKDIIKPARLKSGQVVSIIDGPYKDFKGIIKTVNPNNLYVVEISVFNKPVRAVVDHEHLQKTDYAI